MSWAHFGATGPTCMSGDSESSSIPGCYKAEVNFKNNLPKQKVTLTRYITSFLVHHTLSDTCMSHLVVHCHCSTRYT